MRQPEYRDDSTMSVYDELNRGCYCRLVRQPVLFSASSRKRGSGSLTGVESFNALHATFSTANTTQPTE